MLKTISRKIDQIWEILVIIAAFLLVALLVICAAQVFLRKAVTGGFNWADEAMRFLMVYATFLALPYLVARKKNITIDLSDVLFAKGNGRRTVRLVSELLTLLCCAALLPSAVTFIRMNLTGYSTAMHIPLWAVYLCMPMGLGCSVIASINNLVQMLVLKEDM